MKIAVLGAGAMGGIVAIGLHRGGYDVTIIDPWKPHVDAVRTTGFQMTGFYAQQPVEWRGVIPALHTDELDQLHDKLDVVFVSVKGYNTRRCVELISLSSRKTAWWYQSKTGSTSLPSPRS